MAGKDVDSTEVLKAGSAAPSIKRRELVAGLVGLSGAAVAGSALSASTAPQRISLDPTRAPGASTSALGNRAGGEQPKRIPLGIISLTPLQDLHGTITPADLHFERHHAGIPAIEAAQHELLIHGMVERTLKFSLADLKRFPSVTRTCFLECSGNLFTNAPEQTTPQMLCGLTSQSEWTGVALSTLLREVGVRPGAKWLLAEGSDAAVMTRSIPIEKARDDALVVYAQNGEAIRPEQGYPLRLLLPGWEGNTSIKWLRRIEVADQSFMTREETSKYTDPLPDGTARQFSVVMDARSVITTPTYPQHIEKGWQEIRGLAWSGRGRITQVDVSIDAGRSWQPAVLQGPVLPKAHTRFTQPWHWDGQEAEIQSRAIDETGYVQPTAKQLLAVRGPGSVPYHLNPITAWRVAPSGEMFYRGDAWE